MTLLRTQQPQFAESQVSLVISKAPVAGHVFQGQKLTDAGAINVAGDYECDFATDGMNICTATLKPSAVTGTFAPTLRSLYVDRIATRDSSAGANFAAATSQTLTLTNLYGASVGRVTFSVPSGGSVTFDQGTPHTDPATALAEMSGL